MVKKDTFSSIDQMIPQHIYLNTVENYQHI